ncbi:hypothetical protein GcM3_023031 [Golovinomyces cichoracearum]|uniref:Reverse transcriptase Ty1/copia-type domain-containing protein n=1 Tax=Golovinomyces cichoracearum TaxID=62708 RepID=A0A420J761_9PEZI|nr:hypothetical protein GcM3_023031 [Golovinomyces cichoracearum]
MNIDPHQDLSVQETETPASPLALPDTSFETNIQKSSSKKRKRQINYSNKTVDSKNVMKQNPSLTRGSEIKSTDGINKLSNPIETQNIDIRSDFEETPVMGDSLNTDMILDTIPDSNIPVVEHHLLPNDPETCEDLVYLPHSDEMLDVEMIPDASNCLVPVNGITTLGSPARYFFRKRKTSLDKNDRKTKKLRASIAKVIGFNIQSTQDESTYALVATNTGLVGASRKVQNVIMSNNAIGVKIPRTYNEAISDPIHATEWTNAINEELTGLISNGTWEECILPNKTNLVSTKWVFTIKTNLDGSVERFKTRLVAKDLCQ